MDTAVAPTGASTAAVTHFDVLVIGAGISGIDAAYHLKTYMPERSFCVLESKDDFGGTWKTHTYPGIRSDSDLYTFGYSWKPWVGAPIATAPEILKYLTESIEEQGLGGYIRYRHKVRTASWSSAEQQWRLLVDNLDTGEQLTFTTGFLWMCQGYYDHDRPYTPQWPGMERYRGRIVHPQLWPEDLDYSDMKVLVTALVLFGIGFYKARVTVGRPTRSGVEMMLIGTISALAGYLVGVLLKVPPLP